MSDTRIKLPHNWEPRSYQKALWTYLEEGGKRAIAIWHRRAGKDSLCLNWMAVAAHMKVGTYWHMLPQANQARKAIWDAVNPHTGIRLIDQAFPREIRESTRENEMFIRFKNGSTWQVVGSDNYDSLVGSPPVGVVYSEWSLADPAAWDFLRPILAENKGWAFFIYTPRGRNHGWTLLETGRKSGWFNQILPATETPVFNQAQLDEEKLGYVGLHGPDEGNALYEQEYLCSFDAAIIGSYYGGEFKLLDAQGRICDLPWRPELPVITAWDIGVRDKTSIWFIQQVGEAIHVIDYYESSGVGAAHYVKHLKEKPYSYGEHLLPHDVEHEEWGAGQTRYATLLDLQLKDVRVVEKRDVADGINAARLLLPRCKFDVVRTNRGMEALRQYQREWDDSLKTYKPHPLHNWASHAADAFRYLAVGLRPVAGKANFTKPLFKPKPKRDFREFV